MVSEQRVRGAAARRARREVPLQTMRMLVRVKGGGSSVCREARWYREMIIPPLQK